MIQNYTMHTHTVGFDGQNSPQDMINRAHKLGFKTIGISNHFIVHPNIKQSAMYRYAMGGGYGNIYSSGFDEALARFIPHYNDLEMLREKNPEITILRGMEVDFFNASWWHHGFEKAMAILKPDYLIGSAHFIEYGGGLLNTHDWKNASADVQNELVERYWTNISNVASSGLFTWLAHLDLPKKVGLGREIKWIEYENRAIESIAASNTAIEINTSFFRPDCYEPYPSNRILQMAKQHKVSVLISDDAHKIENIGRHFDEAHVIIRKMGLETIYR